jgi:hypothetical protein
MQHHSIWSAKQPVVLYAFELQAPPPPLPPPSALFELRKSPSCHAMSTRRKTVPRHFLEQPKAKGRPSPSEEPLLAAAAAVSTGEGLGQVGLAADDEALLTLRASQYDDACHAVSLPPGP